MAKTFLWHDYETFGRDPFRERPVQFASIRTDENLQQIEDGTMIYCRQSPDYLPDPGSCQVHGVLPQTANEKGLCEWEFADKIHTLMATPGTCTVGFNSIRFDDEFTRQLLFRNLFDPYSREWRHGNSRWDLIDVVRLTRALRPNGIEWPVDDEGKPTNKLELITAANGIDHGDAHDALADVRATIAVAKLLKEKQPKLFAYACNIRNKRHILSQLDLIKRKPILHISGMYPAILGHLSLVVPLAPHPSNQNGVMVYDLRHDPEDLIKLPADELRERIFTATKDLPEGSQRIAVKTIHANKCPIIAPPNTMDQKTAVKWQLDIDQCEVHRKKLLGAIDEVSQKLTSVFTRYDQPRKDDPDLTLYSGNFASDRDKNTMESLHREFRSGSTSADNSTGNLPVFEDERLNEIYFRLIARNWPDTLDAASHNRWKAFCHQRIHEGRDGFRSIRQYHDLLKEAAVSKSRDQKSDTQEHGDPPDSDNIKKLSAYGEEVAAFSIT